MLWIHSKMTSFGRIDIFIEFERETNEKAWVFHSRLEHFSKNFINVYDLVTI